MVTLPMIFWGAAGQALVLNEILSHSGNRLLALFDNRSDIDSPINSVPVYCGESGLRSWLQDQSLQASEIGFAIAVGGGPDRDALYRMMLEHGLTPTTLCHPTAFIAASAQLGPACQVLAHASVCVSATLGRNCIINTAASVDHESTLGNSVHICPGARVAGEVRIDDQVLVGAGAVILPRIHIGEGATIGAGAVVTKDVPPNTTVAGNPATVIRSKTS